MVGGGDDDDDDGYRCENPAGQNCVYEYFGKIKKKKTDRREMLF